MAMARGAAGTEERRRRRDEESAAEDEGRTSGGGDMVAVSVLFRSGRSHSHSTVLLMPSSSISGCPAHLSRGIAIRDPRTRVHSLDRMIRVDPLHFFLFPFSCSLFFSQLSAVCCRPVALLALAKLTEARKRKASKRARKAGSGKGKRRRGGGRSAFNATAHQRRTPVKQQEHTLFNDLRQKTASGAKSLNGLTGFINSFSHCNF